MAGAFIVLVLLIVVGLCYVFISETLAFFHLRKKGWRKAILKLIGTLFIGAVFIGAMWNHAEKELICSKVTGECISYEKTPDHKVTEKTVWNFRNKSKLFIAEKHGKGGTTYSVHVIESGIEKAIFYNEKEDVLKVFNGLATFFKNPSIKELRFHTYCGFGFYFVTLAGILMIGAGIFNAWVFFFKQPPQTEALTEIKK